SAQGFPIVFFAGRRNDVAGDLAGSRQRAYPALRLPGRLRRDDLSHRLAETRHQNGFPGLADALEDGQASGFEFGNGNFFHVGSPSRWYYGQRPWSIRKCVYSTCSRQHDLTNSSQNKVTASTAICLI